jgi:hypothetical protein
VLYRPYNRHGAKDMLLRFSCASLALVLATQFAASGAQAQYGDDRRDYRYDRDDDRRERRKERKSEQRPVEQVKALQTDGPLLMLVSLNQQRMYVYDSNGLVVQTRVSSGRPGHETPVGIYSILEKKIDHTSNIYLDAKMPHMQRLTMTGIALHGGIIPGYAASGGCVRLPFDFARRFFSMTDINQRVVIVPDVNAPLVFEHPLLFTALPSAASLGIPADSTGAKVIKAGVDLLGVSSAHASTEPPDRTIQSAEEARRNTRLSLVDAVAAAGQRRTAAAEGEKAAGRAIVEARNAAKDARKAAYAADRAASNSASALKSQERSLKKIEARLSNTSMMRADKLEELRQSAVSERERLAPLTADVERTAEAAKSAAEAVKVADEGVAKASADLKAAKAEIKDAAVAETSAKKAVAAFDRQEQNRALPVSVFVSSATGLVQVRQGFEPVIEAQATIENPSEPLDTFIFSAVGWKDDSKTELKWQATEVNENSASVSSFVDEESLDKGKKSKKAPEQVNMPTVTDAAKAQRTLDRIKLPREVEDRIAEVVKPGSTFIVSSYDVSRSETKYAGTDFIVQMPEVVAKITKPTPRPQLEVADNDGGGCFFFCSSYSSSKAKYKKRERVGSKSTY